MTNRPGAVRVPEELLRKAKEKCAREDITLSQVLRWCLRIWVEIDVPVITTEEVVKRLEAEVENLRGNLATGILPPQELRLLNEEIQKRLTRIRELSSLGKQPIGALVGRPLPNQDEIE